MRKVVFAINMTADGYCSHTDGVPDESTYGFFTTILNDASVLLLGRVTYQLMVPYWPDVVRNRTGSEPLQAFARAFDSLEKVVFSTTLQRVEEKARIARVGPIDEVLRLRETPGKAIVVDSLSLASQLSGAGLIDEYHLLVHPVLAGRGPRFFEGNPKETLRLELTSTEAFRSGIVALRYQKRD